MSGRVVEIFISPDKDQPMQSVHEVNLIAGEGIAGDRYCTGQGTFSEMLHGKPAKQVTLIEQEMLDWFNRELNQQQGYGDFRRNILTAGMRLNDLVDKTFHVGDALLKGIKLCEPCKHLAETVNPLVLPHLLGRGGLRAQILQSGVVRCGDSVKVKE